MGRRRADLAFMPGRVVFPGGRVDPADGRVPAHDDLPTDTKAVLHANLRGARTDRRVRAIALAAIRETFEEAGVLIGRPHAGGPHPMPKGTWSDFHHHGLTPALGKLRLAARAITPPGQVRRYDTWFFIANAAETPHCAPETRAIDGELEAVDWVSLSSRANLSLAGITNWVLDAVTKQLNGDGYNTQPAIPHFQMRRGQRVVSWL
ncbi:MAG: NUDIX hydrolase [Pseudomonadota bacterium]